MVVYSSSELAMSESPLKRGFAARVNEIEPFRVLEVLSCDRALMEAGRDIVNLGAGEPDFTTPMDRLDLAVDRLARVLV